MTTAGKGSFGMSAMAADAAIKRKRAEDDAAAKLAADAQEDGKEEPARKLDKEIDAKLPTEVLSELLGKVSYAGFKKTYGEVWRQVAEKRHLMSGRIVYTTTLGGAPLVVRALTQREQQALTAYHPTPVGMGSATAQEHAAKSLEYNTRRIVVQLVSAGDMRFPDYKLSAETREAWEQDAAVRAAYDVVMDWDPMTINHLLGLFADLDQAKYFALVENLRNP